MGILSSEAQAVDAAPPAAGERLVMPYSCAVENGNIVTRPSPERAFTIFDVRQQKLFTTCDPPFSNNCRSITVHRFDIQCGAARVPWIRVVASIKRTNAGNAILSKGHLILARRSASPAGSAPSCADRQSAMSAAVPGECLPWRVARATEQIILPEGFAPAREVGAHFVGGLAPSEWTAAKLMTDGTGVSASGPARRQTGQPLAAGERDVLPEVTLADLSSPPPENADEWVTTTSAAIDVLPMKTAQVTAGGSLGLAPWLALFGCMALAAAYLLRGEQMRLAAPSLSGALSGASRRAREVQDRAVTAVSGLRARLETPAPVTLLDDPIISRELAEAKAQLDRTEISLAALGPAAVLREVMENDLKSVRNRLLAAEEAARSGVAPAMKLRGEFRSIVRDIERIANVSESAAGATGNSPVAIRLPVTESEAYEVLGVDPGVSDAVLALRIESLRHALHVGLAGDATDRTLREVQTRRLEAACAIVSKSRSVLA